MNTGTDDLIRAFLADEARRSLAAAPSLDQAVGRLAPRIAGRPSGASQRLIILLAASLLLVGALGTAIAVGSGILRLAPDEPSVDFGIFEPVAGWIVYGDEHGIWGVDPAALADPATRVQLTSEAGTPLGWSSDGTRLLIMRDELLFVLHSDGSETQVTEQPMANLAIRGAAISPDGSRVVFATIDGAGNTGFVFAVDADGGPAEVLLELDGLEGVSFSPDGTRIAYVTGRGDSGHRVSVMDADGTNPREIVANEVTLDGGHDHGIAWSPAGDRIALGIEGTIYTFAPDGSGFTVALRVGGRPQPFWSPDGSQLETRGPWHPGVPAIDESAHDPSATPPTTQPTEATFEVALHYYADESDEGGFSGVLTRVPEPTRIYARLPDGWVASESAMTMASDEAEHALAISFWAVDAVFIEPCHSEGRADPPMMQSLDMLAGAFTGWWQGDAPEWGDPASPPRDLPSTTEPVRTAVSGLRAQYLEVRIPDDVDIDECIGGRYATWRNAGGVERHHQPGDVSRIWIVEVGQPPVLYPAPSGFEACCPRTSTALLVIDATSQGEPSPEGLTMVEEIIDSLRIEAPQEETR